MPLYYSTGLLAADGTLLKAPTADGTVGQLLQTDGAGQMSFVSDLGSSGNRLGTVYATALNASGASTTGALTVNVDGTSAVIVGTGANTAVAVQVAGSRTRFGYDGNSAYFAGGATKTVSLYANDSVEVFRGTITGFASMSRIFLGTFTTPSAVLRYGTDAIRVFNASDTAHGALHSSALGLGTGTAPVVYLHPGSANEIEQRNGVSAQSHAIYSTYTSSTNYERLRFYTQAAGNHVIASEKGSVGGTLRGIITPTAFGYWSVTPPTSQPATPITLADVIAILQSYGLAA